MHTASRTQSQLSSIQSSSSECLVAQVVLSGPRNQRGERESLRMVNTGKCALE